MKFKRHITDFQTWFIDIFTNKCVVDSTLIIEYPRCSQLFVPILFTFFHFPREIIARGRMNEREYSRALLTFLWTHNSGTPTWHLAHYSLIEFYSGGQMSYNQYNLLALSYQPRQPKFRVNCYNIPNFWMRVWLHRKLFFQCNNNPVISALFFKLLQMKWVIIRHAKINPRCTVRGILLF